MTFPTIAATVTSQEPDNTLNHTVSLPAGIQSGDLLIVLFCTDGLGATTITFPNEGTDWIVLTYLSSGTNKVKVCYRDADGEEGESITVTTNTIQKSAHCAYRITGHSTSQAPECSTGATGASANPDPDSLTPTGGAKDYLWIALQGNDRDRTTSAYPTNYNLSQITIISVGSGGAGAAMCGRNLNASPEDPGTFSISAVDEWCAATVAVHPANGGTIYEIFKDAVIKASALHSEQCTFNIEKDAAVTSQAVKASESTYNILKDAITKALADVSVEVIGGIIEIFKDAIVQAQATFTVESTFNISQDAISLATATVNIETIFNVIKDAIINASATPQILGIYSINVDAAAEASAAAVLQQTLNISKDAVVVSVSTPLIQSTFNIGKDAVVKVLAEVSVIKEGEVAVTKLFLILGNIVIEIKTGEMGIAIN